MRKPSRYSLGEKSPSNPSVNTKKGQFTLSLFCIYGKRGIRTLGELPHTRFPGVPLKPDSDTFPFPVT